LVSTASIYLVSLWLYKIPHRRRLVKVCLGGWHYYGRLGWWLIEVLYWWGLIYYLLRGLRYDPFLWWGLIIYFWRLD
jgi:hypothetical protein